MDLRDLDKVESLHKTEFYSIVTGVSEEDIPFGIGTTAIHRLREKITYENIDNYMKAVKLFEKRHGWYPGIYQYNVDVIKEAYKKHDLEGVKDGIAGILFDIIND